MPRKTPYVMSRVYQSSQDPRLIHCLLDDDYPFGRDKALWEISYTIAPIDGRYPDSSPLKIILATIRVNERGGEEIVSEFVFYSAFALLLYAPKPCPPKFLQFEYNRVIKYSIHVRDENLDKGFQEVYPLLQLSQHTTPEQLLLAKHLKEHGHLPKNNAYSYPMQRYALGR